MDDQYLEPVDWDSHQHRDALRGKSRRIQPWIKVHTQLMHDDRWLELSAAARGLLVCIWLEYSASGGIPLEVSRMSARIQQKVSRKTLTSLNHAGWIRFCAGAEKELDIEKELEKEVEEETEEERQARELDERVQKRLAALMAEGDRIIGK